MKHKAAPKHKAALYLAMAMIMPFTSSAVQTDSTEKPLIDDQFFAEGTYSPGDAFAPTFSHAKADWKVTQGNVSVRSAGLTLPQSGPSSLEIDLGPVVPNKAVKITLAIQSLSETASNDRFDIVFKNAATGKAYTASLSTHPGYFGSSGFCSYDHSGAMIAGKASLSLPPKPRESTLTFQFSPGAGLEVHLNSELAAKWPDYLQLAPVDRIEIHSTGGGWVLKNAQIHATLEETKLAEWIAQRDAERAKTKKARSFPRSKSWQNALTPKGGATSLELVKDGAPQYSILLPANPTPQDRKASRLLKAALDASFGVDFPIAGSSASNPETLRGKVLSLGETTRVPSGFPRIPLGDEGYQLASGADGDVLFLGGKRRGPINAVIAFLEEDLGVRWYSRYLPPSYPDLSGQTPAVVFRHYLPGLEIRDPGFVEAWDAEWALLNRVNGAIPFAPVDPLYGGSSGHAPGLYAHTANNLLPPAEFFPTHPEYFAQIDGKRRSSAHGTVHWCFSNKELSEVIFQSIVKQMAANPEARLISVSPIDGPGGFCQCEKCKKIADQHGGVVAAPLVDFMNRLAEKTKGPFPDLRLSTLAYLESYAPPSNMKIHDGVEIWLATDKHIWSHPYEFLTETAEFQAALTGWTNLGARVVVWDYTFGDNTHWLRPAPNLTVIDRNLDFLLEHGIKGIYWQDNYESPGKSRGPMVAWVMAKKAWNPQWNMDALVADFTEGVYGPAAGPMRAYNELLQQEWETYHARPLPRGKFALSLGFVDTAFALMEEASKLTTNSAVGDLIAREKMSILYERLERGPKAPTDEDAYRKDIEEFAQLAAKFQVISLAERGANVEGKVNQWKRLKKRPKIQAVHVTQAPTIDGVLSPEEWNAARRHEDWTTLKGVASTVSTGVQVMWDEAHVYLAFRCREPEGYEAVARYLEYNSEVFKDDSVEIFLQADQVIPGNYEQICINAAGAVKDLSAYRAGWKSNIRVATRKEKGAWTVEAAIPVASLGIEKLKPNDVWQVNFGRNSLYAKEHSPESQNSNWSGPNGYHNPDQFGELIFAK
jgi:hypothetical protein